MSRYRRRVSLSLSAAVLLIGARAAPLNAYEGEPTHRDLALRSVNLAWVLHHSYGELPYYRDLIATADSKEDEFTGLWLIGFRLVHHFYDPTTSLGLPRIEFHRELPGAPGTPPAPSWSRSGTYMNALDWGRDGMPDHLDWQSAIQAYDYDKASRERAYTALGHVLHLVQDMGQPDHATDRPHPGDTLRENLKATHLKLGLFDKVGYEGLWAKNLIQGTDGNLYGKWPKGRNPRKRASLQDFFDELAALSQKKARDLGLPLDDEKALGLGPLEGTPTADLKGYVRHFEKNGWEHFLLGLALIPTIPWPNNQDFRTRAYLQLGTELLPAVEEYGAGLLQLFHDIVAPPPVVLGVEIRQNGQPKYHKVFADLHGPDGKLSGRRATPLVDGQLIPGQEAEVIVRFGPSELQGQEDTPPEHGFGKDENWQLRVQLQRQSIRVRVEPEGSPGTPSTGCLAPSAGATDVRGHLDDRPSRFLPEVTWKGTFIPDQSGLLCIDAQDIINHFEGRRDHGDRLDSDPATPARATSKAPYDWVGYEPGPDRNHRFSVRQPDCTPGDETTLAKLKWAEISGTASQQYDGDRGVSGSLKVQIRGHAQYRAWEIGISGRGRAQIKETGPDDKGVLVSYQNTCDAELHAKINLARRDGDYSLSLDVAGCNLHWFRPGWSFDVRGAGCQTTSLRGSQASERENVEWNFALKPVEPPVFAALCEGFHGGIAFDAVVQQLYLDVVKLEHPVVAGRRELLVAERTSTLLKSVEPLLRQLHQSELDLERLCPDLQHLWVYDTSKSGEAEYLSKLAKYSATVDLWNLQKRDLAARWISHLREVAASVRSTDVSVADALERVAARLEKAGLDGTGP